MIELSFDTNFAEIGELNEVLRAFFPAILLSEGGDKLYLDFAEDDASFEAKLLLEGELCAFEKMPKNAEWGVFEYKRERKRFAKIFLYKFLSSITKTDLPYGSLTGIRPTKLYKDLNLCGDAEKLFTDYFKVSKEKTELVKRIVEVQNSCRNLDKMQIDLFINIPFCPSRCAYCSFIAVPIEKLKKSIPSYVDCLIREIELLKVLAKNNGFKIRSAYVGGGTPTSLQPEILQKILKTVDFRPKEFTVEAGRPDTITSEILDVLKNCGVTRISINPQTFCDKTLQLIGRRHTVADFYRAFELSKNYDFDVNIDLIAALPQEIYLDFKNSVDRAIELDPENITVHTMSLKRGSSLTTDGYDNISPDVSKMVDYGHFALDAAGYRPYYLYRQKYTCGNFENTGYAKPKTECLYNIDIMEEDTAILAAGSGAISKKIDFDLNRISRQPNFKDVKEYILRFDEILLKTEEFWK